MDSIRSAALVAVREGTAALTASAPGVSRSEAEALHDVRVAVRRIRSVLRSAGPAFAGHDPAALETRLQELGRELSAARDQEVLAAGLRRLAAISPDVLEAPSGAAAGRLRSAWAAAVEALTSPVFTRLVDDLQAFADVPPPPAKRVTADDVLRRDLRRVRRRVRRAAEDGLNSEERETRLHDVRKAAKRLRYDLTAFSAGASSSDLRDAAERIQDALGDRRDALALAKVLGAEEQRAPEDGARELGRLRRSEQDRAEAALTEYGNALPALVAGDG